MRGRNAHGPRSPLKSGQCLWCRQMGHSARDSQNRGSRVVHWCTEFTENWDHSDIRGLVHSVRQNPTVLPAPKLMKCDACQAKARFTSTSGEWKTYRTWGISAIGHFSWTHPTLGIQTKKSSAGGRGHTCQWLEVGRHLLVQKTWETSHRWKSKQCFKSVGSSISCVWLR